MAARTIGQFELDDAPLGEGGVGQVYAARDRELGRAVAIKMLRPQWSRDRALVSRFRAEATNLARLSHPNITTLYSLLSEGQDSFMVMELVHGRTLEELLSQVGRLGLRESLAVIAQTAGGLAYAHQMGVVHRDIKPSNLMVTDSGLLKIMDFGIARVRGSQRLTRAGQLFGTLLYTSPEQIRGGEGDERSDIYALGIVLYEMLTGSPPFVSENEHELMTQHLERAPAPLAGRVPGLDPAAEAAVLRALAKTPEERFGSVAEFAVAVGAQAVRGEALDILRDCLAGAFRNVAPKGTRLLDTSDRIASAPGSAPPGRAGDNGSAALAPPLGHRPWPQWISPAMRGPAILLGAVLLSLSLGLGYLAWPSRPVPPTPHGQDGGPAPAPPKAPSPNAMVEPPRREPPRLEPPPTAPPSPSAPPVAAPAPTPAPANPAPAPRAPAFPPVATPAPLPTPAPIPAPSPAPAPRLPAWPPAPAQPAPVPASPAFVMPPLKKPDAPTPEGPPSLQGRVSAVIAADALRVDDKVVNLYGILDPAKDQPGISQHREAMQRYLDGAQGYVVCYAKLATTYRCYVGERDIAILALLGGIAQTSRDAPPEYRLFARHPAR
jgi:serine/threonine-protein kinase